MRKRLRNPARGFSSSANRTCSGKHTVLLTSAIPPFGARKGTVCTSINLPIYWKYNELAPIFPVPELQGFTKDWPEGGKNKPATKKRAFPDKETVFK